MIRRTKEECGINLPPKQIIDIPIVECAQPYASTLQDMELQQQEVNNIKYPYAIDFINNLLQNGKRPVVFVHHKNLMKDLMDKYRNIAVNIYGGQTAEERECLRSADTLLSSVFVSLLFHSHFQNFAVRTVDFLTFNYFVCTNLYITFFL